MSTTTTKPVRCTTLVAGSHIAQRVPFIASALSADWHHFRPSVGILPESHVRELQEAFDRSEGQGVYIVFSYATPIGWYEPALDRWTRPQVRYSVTTSKHQGKVPRD